MSDPVIIDCGGSTRIKQLLSAGNSDTLDPLVDVDFNNGSGEYESNAPASANAPGGFTSVNIVYIDQAGNAAADPNSPFTVAANNKIDVTSDNNQRVTVTIKAATADIKVHATGGIQPFVEGRSYKKKRRYEISNAGPILGIAITTPPPKTQPAVPPGSIYTSITLS